MKTEPTYVGIDVAKDRVDIFIRPTGHSWSVYYGEAELDELVAKLQTVEPEVAIVEATGGLEPSPGGSNGLGIAASGGGQSPSGTRFCQVYRPAGQD